MSQDGAPTAATGPVAVPVLTAAERRQVVVAGLAPAAAIGAAMAGLVVAGLASVADLIVGTVVYGGLLGLALAVVVHERADAGHCPACDAPGPTGRLVCDRCGYDLAARPMFRCDQGHQRHVAAGVCACGRRLAPIEREQGIGRELRRILWAGAWVAAFLLGVLILIRYV